MGLSSRLLRLPKPKTFLGTMSLSTGASLITLSLLLNKLSGLYGILALLTGYGLSPFQLSMYIYSIAALFVTIYLSPHIKTQSPFHCLALASVYVLDSVINALYTAAFAVTWFLVLANHSAGTSTDPSKAPGAGTMNDTAGFTDPKMNVSRVEVLATPQPGLSLSGGQDAVAAGVASSSPAGADTAVKDFVLGREGINSITTIVTLWTIRAYFCLVMLSWARMVVRQHIAVTSVRSGTTYSNNGNADVADNPFAEGKPEGQGRKGKLGRFLIALGRTYFLGIDENDSWTASMNGKFNSRKSGHNGVAGNADASTAVTGNGIMLHKIESGPTERERRRRSGTGPPLPAVQAAAGKEDIETGGLLQVPSQ